MTGHDRRNTHFSCQNEPRPKESNDLRKFSDSCNRTSTTLIVRKQVRNDRWRGHDHLHQSATCYEVMPSGSSRTLMRVPFT
jgi:hypothetical protein